MKLIDQTNINKLHLQVF